MPIDILGSGYIKIAILVATLLSGMYLEHKIEDLYYSSKITTLENSVNEFKTAYNSVAGSLVKQNAGIQDLENKTKEKEEQVKMAQEIARSSSKQLYEQAKEIMQLKENNSSNSCLDASKLIDTELAKERK